ncbi:MAG: DALR domain-containing protein, partial [Nitrospirales bacterium]
LIERLERHDIEGQGENDQSLKVILDEFKVQFEQAMDDDLNTPKALGEFERLRGLLNKLLPKGLSIESKKQALKTIRDYGKPLGIYQLPEEDWRYTVTTESKIPVEVLQGVESTHSIQIDGKGWIDEQIQKRLEAKKRKDFATADKIRQNLSSQGITLEDRPDGTTRWKR